MENTTFKTLEQIRQIPVPVSAIYMKGYQAVPHIEVINEVKERLDKQGINVVKEVYKTNKLGHQLYGSILTDMKLDNDLGGGIHFVNSYDKTRKLQIRSGSIVFICSNGMIRMNNVTNYSRKHVGSVNEELITMVEQSINSLEEEYKYFIEAKEKFKRIKLSKTVQAELVGRLFVEHDLLTTVQASMLKTSINRTEGNFIGNTAWDFYNNTTEALKLTHPSDYLQNHMEFHQFMVEELNLV